jgi:hypothetical protein
MHDDVKRAMSCSWMDTCLARQSIERMLAHAKNPKKWLCIPTPVTATVTPFIHPSRHASKSALVACGPPALHTRASFPLLPPPLRRPACAIQPPAMPCELTREPAALLSTWPPHLQRVLCAHVLVGGCVSVRTQGMVERAKQRRPDNTEATK